MTHEPREALEPCPFCGGNNVILSHKWDYGFIRRCPDGKWIGCDEPPANELRDEPEKFRRVYLSPPPAAGWNEAITTVVNVAKQSDAGGDMREAPNVETIAALLYEAANPTMRWSYLWPSHNHLHATVRQRFLEAAARFQDSVAQRIEHSEPDEGRKDVGSNPIAVASNAVNASVEARLREALEALIADIEDYERVNNLAPSPGKKDCWQSVMRAKQALSSPPAAAETFQSRVQLWMMACFGPKISADCVERNHRFLEEALELVQSTGCTQSEAHQLVDYVYGRPAGETRQEIGGVMVTLAALCLALGDDMHAAGETELARIWTKVDKIRAKQAAKPKHSPLPGPSEAAAAESNGSVEATYKVGRWLSAALDDPTTCAEMKADINAWFAAGKPNVQPTDESAEARLREAVLVSIDMIENCAGVPTNPDSLPQMVKVYLQQAVSAAGDEAKKSEGGTIVAPYNPCLAKLRKDEPFFVLLGRDKQAPTAVIAWADARERAEGKSGWTDEAREVAATMVAYSGATLPSDPTADRREIVARIINPTAWAITPEAYGLKSQDQLETQTQVGTNRRIAREKADAILAALDKGRDNG